MAKKSFPEMDWAAYCDSLKGKAREETVPLLGTFELTPLCNFDCKMCYVHLKPEQMRKLGRLRTAQEWLDLGRQACDAGTLTLLLTGGEVMTRPDFAEIYAGLSEMGFIISIFSNGYLLTDKVLDLLRRRPPLKVRVTLYGASNETYRRLCGVPDGYDRVMENIRLLQAAGVEVGLAFTATSYNFQDLPLVRRTAKKLDATLQVAADLFSPVRGADKDVQSLQLNPSQLEQMATWDANQNTSGPSQPDKPQPQFQAVIEKAKKGQLYGSPLEVCGSRRCGFWVTWNGNMSMCAMVSSVHTEPFDAGFVKAWKELCARMEQLQFPEPCKTCAYMPFCTSCPGRRAADAGDPERICPRHCEQAKAQMRQAR